MDVAVDQPLLCELIGPAGAGKSTTCSALRSMDSAIQVRGGITKRSHLVPLLLHTLRMLPGAMLMRVQCGRSGFRELTQLAHLRALDDSLKQGRDAAETAVILDEGPVFTLAWIEALGERSVIGSPWFRRQIEREIGRWAEQLDLLIWLDASDELLVNRIRTRPQTHRAKRRSDSEISAFLNNYRDTYRRVIARLESCRAQNIVEFDTGRDSGDGIARKILSTVDAERDKK